MPTVSVLLPVYNNEKELPRAILGLLHQSFTDFEVIAVDDGSTDGSGNILDYFATQDKRIKVIHQANMGISEALNCAISVAQGTYLARQDADDVSAPTRFARQVYYLDRSADVTACGSWSWYVDPVAGPQYYIAVPDIPLQLAKYLEKGANPWVHGSVMMRHSTVKRLGTWYRGGYAEDFDLWLRLAQLGRLGMLQSVEYFYWLSTGGVVFGTLRRGQALVSLYVKLHHERAQHGREVTEWQAEYERIITDYPTESAGNRVIMAQYVQGINHLQRQNWASYRSAMSLSAGGQGDIAAKARLHVRFACGAWLIRAMYGLKNRNSPFRYQRMLPADTTLPDYAKEGTSA